MNNSVERKMTRRTGLRCIFGRRVAAASDSFLILHALEAVQLLPAVHLPQPFHWRKNRLLVFQYWPNQQELLCEPATSTQLRRLSGASIAMGCLNPPIGLRFTELFAEILHSHLKIDGDLFVCLIMFDLNKGVRNMVLLLFKKWRTQVTTHPRSSKKLCYNYVVWFLSVL